MLYTPPPLARRPSELLWSLHYLPLVGSGVVTFAGLALHILSLRWTVLLALPLAAVSLTTHLVEPILTFAPVGGRYGVRTVELSGDPHAKEPPLTLFYPTLLTQGGNDSRQKLDFTRTSPADSENASFLSSWLPFQDVRFLDGMARYAHLPAFLLRGMKLTRIRESVADRKAPLFTAEGRPRSIVLFSHGLAGYPRLYSCLLMDLAARGVLVIGMTHTDGSAAFCRDVSGDATVPIDTTLDWEVETREKQMMVRVRETRATLDRIQSGQVLREVGYPEDDVQRYLDAAGGCPGVTLVGHSFGAATVMGVAMEEQMTATKQKAATASPETPSRVRAVIALDPWGQPLCGEYFHKAILSHEKLYTTPTLQFHSEAWVRWDVSWDFFRLLATDLTDKQHFTVAQRADLAEAGRRTAAAGLSTDASWYTLRTSPGTTHLSYCDLTQLSPVVYKKPFAKAPPRAQIVDWANACVQFAAAHELPLAHDKEVDSRQGIDGLTPSSILQRLRESNVDERTNGSSPSSPSQSSH